MRVQTRSPTWMVSIDRSPSSVETSVPGAKQQGPSLGTALAVLVADCPSPVARSLGPSATSVGVVSLTSGRSEEHTSELQSLTNLVCRLLLEKKKTAPAAGRRVYC